MDAPPPRAPLSPRTDGNGNLGDIGAARTADVASGKAVLLRPASTVTCSAEQQRLAKWAAETRSVREYVFDDGEDHGVRCQGRLLFAALAAFGVRALPEAPWFEHSLEPAHNRFARVRAAATADVRAEAAAVSQAAAQVHTAQLQYALQAAALLDGQLT